MPDNALLYTMTTIAESLGSAMALLAAFALYRLQSLSRQMEEDSRQVAEAIGGFATPEERERLAQLRAAEDWQQFITLMVEVRNKLQGDPGINPRLWMARLPRDYQTRRAILAALSVALILTAIVMTGALFALARSNDLPADSCLPALGVVGFVLCLASYLVLIWFALGRARPQLRQ
jgi:hypothetical protein